MSQVVTQLLIDARGAKAGAADFEEVMAKAKVVAIDGGNASFGVACRRWVKRVRQLDGEHEE